MFISSDVRLKNIGFLNFQTTITIIQMWTVYQFKKIVFPTNEPEKKVIDRTTSHVIIVRIVY